MSPRRSGLAILFVVTLGLVILGIAANAGWLDTRPPRLTIYSTPAPVTFIPPTPLPPTITPTDPVVAHPIPDAALATLDGQTIRLGDFAGEIVFLNFWATWCEPCREEMPELQAFQDQYGAQGVRVIAVTDPTDGQTEDDIRAFVDEFGLTFTVALSSDDDFYRPFGLMPIPTTFIIDRAGIVRARHVGALHDHDMVGYLTWLTQTGD